MALTQGNAGRSQGALMSQRLEEVVARSPE